MPLQIVLLVFPETGDIDKSGELALAVLRDFGLPNLVPAVVPPSDAPLKVRSASKKLAAEALRLQVRLRDGLLLRNILSQPLLKLRTEKALGII